MTTNKDFQQFQKFLAEQKQQQIDEALGAALKSAGKMAAATSALSGGLAAGQTAAQGGSKDDVVKAGIEGAKSIVTSPYEKYKKGDYIGATWDVATTVNPYAASAQIGKDVGSYASEKLKDYTAGSPTMQKVGREIGNLPGAQTLAKGLRGAGEYLGLREPSKSQEPEQPASDMVARKVQSIPITPPTQQTSTTDEIVPRKVKTTIERESGGRTIKSFKQFHKNK